jgi:hypothetical protein
MTYSVQYDGSTINVDSININYILKSKSSLTITIGCKLYSYFEDWEARKYNKEIIVYDDSTKIFIGYISSVSFNSTQIILNCISKMDELNWGIIEDCEFIKDEVQVSEVPTGDWLYVETKEGESPNWTLDSLIKPIAVNDL